MSVHMGMLSCVEWLGAGAMAVQGKTQLRILAARSCPRLVIDFPCPPERGRRECRVRAAPAVSCAKVCKNAHTSIQVQRRHPTFPAQWFTAYTALSPVIGLCCHRRPSEALASSELDASIEA